MSFNRLIKKNNIIKAFSSVPKVEIEINNRKVKVDSGTTILQACSQIGVEVPRFCYHPELSVAGNCR